MKFKIDHDSCYGHGCASCGYTGYVRDYEAEEDYYDYRYEMKRDEELMDLVYDRDSGD